MMLLILMQTGGQCSNLSQTQEADKDHLPSSTEVEQMEECHKTRMGEMDNKEIWLNCVMHCRSSWVTEKALLEERGVELDVFTSIEHRLRGEAADQEWHAFAKKRLQNCSGKCAQHQRSRGWESTLREEMIAAKKK